VVPFPLAAAAPGRFCDHLGARLLERPPLHAHAVQFYDDEAFLIETVATFLEAGFLAGDAAIVIATAERTDALTSKLGAARVAEAVARGELILIDANAMLGRFMRGDKPSEPAFTEALGKILDPLTRAAPPARRVRAFGEMVDILWRQGKPQAAIELEALWSRAAARRELALLCAYSMGNFYRADSVPSFGDICRLHTHAMPTEAFVRQDGDEFERLREISLLEQRARLLHNEVQYRKEVEQALRQILGERSSAERELRARIERESIAGIASRAEALLAKVATQVSKPLGGVTRAGTSGSESARPPLSLVVTAVNALRARLAGRVPHTVEWRLGRRRSQR
jgi:DcmR-like sensory protein